MIGCPTELLLDKRYSDKERHRMEAARNIHKKRRTMQHVMEENSMAIVREKLPAEWVIHSYSPDYGIDCVVEMFEYVDGDQRAMETLGEFFFVQVKSEQSVHATTKRVYRRKKVEKVLEQYAEESAMMSVIPYAIDVSLLHTVMAMGSTAPVVLLLVDLSKRDVYFVCLNDYIEKILLLDETFWTNESSKTIYIPTGNKADSRDGTCHLAFLARRAKLFGAFNKFAYQRHELDYDHSIQTVRHFLSIIKKYDFWDARVKWPAQELVYSDLLNAGPVVFAEGEEQIRLLREYCSFEPDEDEDVFAQLWDQYAAIVVFPLWEKLCNMSRIYEEICKEWFLPTYLWAEWY